MPRMICPLPKASPRMVMNHSTAAVVTPRTRVPWRMMAPGAQEADAGEDAGRQAGPIGTQDAAAASAAASR